MVQLFAGDCLSVTANAPQVIEHCELALAISHRVPSLKFPHWEAYLMQ